MLFFDRSTMLAGKTEKVSQQAKLSKVYLQPKLNNASEAEKIDVEVFLRIIQ